MALVRRLWLERPAAVLDQVLAAAKAEGVQGWRHRPDRENELAKKAAETLAKYPSARPFEIYCFTRERQGDRSAAMVYLWRRSPEVLCVANIIAEQGAFGVEEYNAVLDEFNEQILQPSLANVDDPGED